MDIFEIKDKFEPLSQSEEKAVLLQYLETGDEVRAAQIMNRVGMLDRETGGKCLVAALSNCSAELLQKLLDHVPRGEYAAERWSTPRTEPPEELTAEVSGTLPTLAAAMGKAEHLRLLLDWGCDVNSASADAVTELLMDGHAPYLDRWGVFFPGILTACGRSGARWCRMPVSGLIGLTPLAAGIAFGKVSCVQLLLEREGVWLTEAPAVSEALVLRGAPWDTEAHQTCRRLVRTKPDGSLRPLTLCAAISRMDEASLRDELDRCAYDREAVIRAALALADVGVQMREEDWREAERMRWRMFSVLGERYPDAMQDERVRRRLAERAYCDFEAKDNPLPEAAEQALGDTVDLDESTVGDANYSAPLAETCLKRFGKNRRLVMSRDLVAGPFFSPMTASYLRILLRYVEFRAPSLPVGVSGLTAAILRCGDVRLLRQALHRGLIPAEEPTERLLALAGKNTAMRSLLLTQRRPSLGLAPAGAEDDSYRVLSEEEEERVLADPALRAAASDALLFNLLRNRSLQIRWDKQSQRWGGFETAEYADLCALRGETDIVLRLALWDGPEAGTKPDVAVVTRADMPDDYMYMTRLCCAAAGGQTETVRALLDAGFDPEERDMGQPSELNICKDPEMLSLSPLLCTLLWERWDTAALLLERGARCDLTCYTVRRAFKEVRGGDVPYADIRRELGAYLKERKLERMD